MLTAESDDEGTKIFLEIDDDARVNEGRCRGVLKIWASSIVGCSMGGLYEIGVTREDVKVKVW